MIPCIIPPYMEEILPLGSQFEYEVCLNLGTADLGVDEQGMPVGTSIADWHKRTFEVVGVIAENAYNIMGYSQANDYFSSGYGDITNVLEPLCDRSGQSGSGLHTPGYIPDILHNGKSHFDATSTPCYYLFPQAEADITAADINAALTGLGGVQSARRLTDMYMQNYKSGGRQHLFHARLGGGRAAGAGRRRIRDYTIRGEPAHLRRVLCLRHAVGKKPRD